MKASRCFSATLQLMSDTMTAADMAKVLGDIDGVKLSEKGQKISDRSDSRTMEVSIWELKSKLSEDSDLPDQVSSLLAVIESKASQFESLLRECDAEIWCFVTFDGSQCGFVLDQALIKKLSSLSISLVFDIYS